MDMYTEMNGFQIFEGMTPFDAGSQARGADSLPAAPYQAAAAETAGYISMDMAGSLPAGPYQETVAETAGYGGVEMAEGFPAGAYQGAAAETAGYGGVEMAESLPAGPYQETAGYGAETYMEDANALPVGLGQMQVPETEDPGLYQYAVSETELDDTEQAEIPETEETGLAAEPDTAEPQTAELETAGMEATEPETGAAPAADGEDDEETRRARHEAAEAERKAEWEARRQAKKNALKKQQEELAGMSDGEVVEKSMKRISADTEKLTRRNMKDCVAEYIQTLCLEDVEFARMTMDPRKSMVHCFQYISRKAWDYVQDEMKADGVKPGTGQQGYGCDVPDDLCYQWAEDYFRDPLAKEDEGEEEKFIPKPYAGKTGYKPAAKKKTEKKEKKPKAPEKKPEPGKKAGEAEVTQLSLLDLMPQEDRAS